MRLTESGLLSLADQWKPACPRLSFPFFSGYISFGKPPIAPIVSLFYARSD